MVFYPSVRRQNIFLAMGLLVCILLPDVLINLILDPPRAFWNWIAFFFLAFLCYGLSYLPKKPFLVLWGLFGILEAIQFSYIAYFGVSLSPSALVLVVHEHQDIFDLTYLRHLWFVYPIVGAVYAVGTLIFMRYSLSKKTAPLWSSLMVIYSLSLILSDGLTLRPLRLMKVVREQPDWLMSRFCMRTPSPSLNATLLTLSCTASQLFLPSLSHKAYIPYTLTPFPTHTKNIVLVMGESLNCTHLSLFGYPRKTTPYLDRLAQDPHFFFKPAYSAAPNTKTSLMLFFNLVREPDNMHPLQTGAYNLFRSAKQNGFKTFLITNNDGSRSMGPNIDNVYTSVLLDNYPFASYPKDLQEKKDRGLSHLLKTLDLGEKNFIVLHMRAPHSPYEKAYASDKAFSIYPETGVSSQERLVNTYDNCVLYIDKVLSEIALAFAHVFRNRGDSYLLFTADHGELFGEQDPQTGAKMYGHGHLTLSCVHVPFWVYTLQEPPLHLVKTLTKNPSFSAYDIGKVLLSLMGERLINQQEKQDIGYVSSGLRGETLTYQKKSDGSAHVMSQAP